MEEARQQTPPGAGTPANSGTPMPMRRSSTRNSISSENKGEPLIPGVPAAAEEAKAPARPADEATAARAREAIVTLLGAGTSSNVEAAKSEAVSVELSFVHAMEAAIGARQESAHVKVALERARSEERTANERARVTSGTAESAIEVDEAAAKAVEAAAKDVEKAQRGTVDADARRANAQQDVAKCEAAVVAAQEEIQAASEAHTEAQENARLRLTDMKEAKTNHGRAMQRSDDGEKAVVDAGIEIKKSEERAVSRAAGAKEAAKKAYACTPQQQGSRTRIRMCTVLPTARVYVRAPSSHILAHVPHCACVCGAQVQHAAGGAGEGVGQGVGRTGGARIRGTGRRVGEAHSGYSQGARAKPTRSQPARGASSSDTRTRHTHHTHALDCCPPLARLRIALHMIRALVSLCGACDLVCVCVRGVHPMRCDRGVIVGLYRYAGA